MSPSVTGNNSLVTIVMNVSDGSNATMGSKGYYDPNKDECTLLARLVINTVIGGGGCFLGLAGNALSFIVLRKDKQTPVASFLLQTLACMDSFFLGLWFVHFSVNDIFDFAYIDQYTHKIWVYIRLYSYPFLFISQTATIWLTVLIATTRFIAICIPYRSSQLCNMVMVKKGVILTSVFSIVYNLPRFFDTKIVHVVKNGTDKYYFKLAPLGISKIYRLGYLDIAYYIFSFVLPLLVLAVLNTKLTVAYRKVQQRRRHLRGTDQNRDKTNSNAHSDPNITLVMIIVVLVFMLCNLPARLVQITLRYKDQECMSLEFLIKEISNVLEVLNSSTNFIIYCAFRQKFRENLRNMMCWASQSSPIRSTRNDVTMATLLNGHHKDQQTNGEQHPVQV